MSIITLRLRVLVNFPSPLIRVDITLRARFGAPFVTSNFRGFLMTSNEGDNYRANPYPSLIRSIRYVAGSITIYVHLYGARVGVNMASREPINEATRAIFGIFLLRVGVFLRRVRYEGYDTSVMIAVVGEELGRMERDRPLTLRDLSAIRYDAAMNIGPLVQCGGDLLRAKITILRDERSSYLVSRVRVMIIGSVLACSIGRLFSLLIRVVIDAYTWESLRTHSRTISGRRRLAFFEI